jgi:protein translocase SecG subunit
MRLLLIAQAIIAVLLTVSILLQNRGSGLGSAFGSDFGGYYTKRGFERFLVYATIVLAVVFFGFSAVNVYYSTIAAGEL